MEGALRSDCAPEANLQIEKIRKFPVSGDFSLLLSFGGSKRK